MGAHDDGQTVAWTRGSQESHQSLIQPTAIVIAQEPPSPIHIEDGDNPPNGLRPARHIAG
jgi:hypothetical protein